MQFRHQYPMIRLLIPFMGGIITAQLADLSIEILPIAMSIIFLAAAAWIIHQGRRPNYRYRWMLGILISTGLFLYGYIRISEMKEINDPDYFTIKKSDYLFIRIDEDLQEKEKSWKTVSRVRYALINNKIVAVKGNLLVYLKKDTSMIDLPSYGDFLIIKSNPSLIPYSGNPGTFNYRQYLSTRQIYHQVFLVQNDWRILNHNSTPSIKGSALKIRKHLLSRLTENNIDGKEFGIAAALLLGQDDFLDPETRKGFSSAGVVHILGISGLHVGIIFLAINQLLKFADKLKRGRFLKLVIVLSVIWFYAFITGLSPAALRSCSMFTFVTLGSAWKRNVHIINSLATSAFFLLWIDPYLVANPGFQFSYIAVTGIVLIHEPLYRLWEPGNRIVDSIWNLSVMSVAAQLFTFPLTLYYFHQFPVYFLPANLVVIPLSNLIIYCGMALFGVAYIPMAGKLLGAFTSLLMKGLTIFTECIEDLPCSVIRDIYTDLPVVLIVYGVVGFLAAVLVLRRKKYIYRLLFCCLVLICYSSCIRITHLLKRDLWVCNVSKHTAVLFTDSRMGFMFTDSALLYDTTKFNYSLGGIKAALGIKNLHYYQLIALESGLKNTSSYHRHLCNGEMVYIAGKRIGIVNNLPGKRPPETPLKLNYLIITGNPRLSPGSILKYFTPEVIVLDASNSFSKSKKWTQEFLNLKIPVLDTRVSGAIHIRL